MSLPVKTGDFVNPSKLAGRRKYRRTGTLPGDRMVKADPGQSFEREDFTGTRNGERVVKGIVIEGKKPQEKKRRTYGRGK